jgi:PAS domain S-box-containing protein
MRRTQKRLIIRTVGWTSAALLGIGIWIGPFPNGQGTWTSWADAFLFMPYGLLTLGVIGLFWRYRVVVKAVEHTVEHIRNGHPLSDRRMWTPAAQALSDSIVEVVQRQRTLAQQLQTEIYDLQIQIQLLQQQKKHTEAIIYSLHDAVLVVDDTDRLLMANDAAGELFGFDHKEASFQPIAELIKDDPHSFVDFLRRTRISQVAAHRCELEFPAEDTCRAYDCIVSCIHDENQSVCGTVAVLHDITREREISRLKDDFISYVSHELKTPLASITAYVEMLLDGEADTEQMRREFYTIIQNQATRLNRLIEDILNISRIESGLTKVHKEPLSLAILIEEQVQMIKGYAEERDIRILGQKPIVYDQVYADRDMMSRVIINLLSNAIKYNCPGGSVRIETEVDEGASLVRVSVTDSGAGLSPEELAHVFDKFYRAGSNENKTEGTGLGLCLVKRIVETLHGGSVFVKSQVGAGSTFGFELPLATPQDVAIGTLSAGK